MKKIVLIMLTGCCVFCFYRSIKAETVEPQTVQELIGAAVKNDVELEVILAKTESQKKILAQMGATVLAMEKEDRAESQDQQSVSGAEVSFYECYTYAVLLNSYIERYNSVAAEVAGILIDIDLGWKRHGAYSELLDKKQATYAAEKEKFSIGKSDGVLLAELADSVKTLTRQLKDAGVLMQSRRQRLYELTGYDLPEAFNLESAYFIVDMAKVSEELAPILFDVSIFIQADGFQYMTAADIDVLQLRGTAEQSFALLGDTVRGYVLASRDLQQADALYKTGKIGTEQFQNSAERERYAWIQAIDAKAAYAKTILSLDEKVQGRVSLATKPVHSIFLAPEQWRVQNGLLPDMEEGSGYYFMGGSNNSFKLEQTIVHIPVVPEEVRQRASDIQIFYAGEIIAQGDVVTPLILTKIAYNAGSLLYIRFINETGEAIGIYAINGFFPCGTLTKVSGDN